MRGEGEVCSCVSDATFSKLTACLQFTLVLTGDHSTPVLYGDHSCEPVPFVITKAGMLFSCITLFQVSPSPVLAHAHAHYSKKHHSAVPHPTSHCPSDDVHHFSEVDASAGALGRFPGSEVMTLIKRYRDA
jgi:2,3-bisphosphoglycerate-independent phosphoglycerate mutase